MTVAAGEPPGAPPPPPELLAGSALRRLHYKATRRAHSAAAAAARHRPTSPVPKVIVMGSSTTSDKTINTSTDSAATAVTSVTGTDDSLDTEPADPPSLPNILDEDSPPAKPSYNDTSTTKPNSAPPGYHKNGDPLVPTVSYGEKYAPNTAPPGYHRNGEPVFQNEFSSPAYTKPQSATDKVDSPRPGPGRFIFDVPLPVAETENSRPNTPITAKLSSPQHAAHLSANDKYESPKSPKITQSKYETHFKFEKPKSPLHETHFKFEKPKSPKLEHAKFDRPKSPKHEQLLKFDRPKSPKHESHFKFDRPKSPKQDSHFKFERPKSPKHESHFKFDRPKSPKHDSHFKFDRPKSPKHESHFKFDRPKSPKHESHFKFDRPKSPKHESHFKFDRPKSPKHESHFKFDRPKSPKETHFKFDRPKSPVKRRGSEPRMKKKDYYKDGNDSVAKLRRQLEGAEVFHNRRRSSHQVPLPSGSRRQSTNAQVHVTANPLDSASTTSIPAGRTTIVVQQPSLSLEYAGCATLLLRDQDEPGRRRSKCQEHLQQLLDVTSQFTSEDLHDFDKRYGSPHHSRSQSVKAARTGERQLLGLPQQRARVASMPNTGVEEEYYRLRHFSITGKGVVNRGDSLRSRRSRSNTSVASSASSNEHLTTTRASAPCSLASSRDSSAGISSYRVLVLGAAGVGKSSLVGQFMTSEYLHAYDTSIDDESGERSVCVLLAGEESEITFLDSPPDSMIMEGTAHGYCVVYSTAERGSLAEAERRLQALWAGGHTARRAVILVGNKADLARSRAVPTEEGKSLATSYDCKFIETSVGINHNVDELLVGLLTQIRLKQQHAERVRKRSGSRKNRSRNRSPHEPERPEPPPTAPLQPPGSANSTPRKRGRLSASVKVRGLLGRVWARDSKSKSCENLHVL